MNKTNNRREAVLLFLLSKSTRYSFIIQPPSQFPYFSTLLQAEYVAIERLKLFQDMVRRKSLHCAVIMQETGQTGWSFLGPIPPIVDEVHLTRL